MKAVGIVSEYNPFHKGHEWHIAETKKALGKPIIAMMSGNFVQRGDFAIMRKHARAEAAVRGGADLVLELPSAQALLSAEGFAEAAVGALAATGVVDTISYGSECGNTAPLREIAAALLSPDFDTALQQELPRGEVFARARQNALASILGDEKAALLSEPNNILGVEYEKVCLTRGLDSFTISRIGAAHDGETKDGIASASRIRECIAAGEDVTDFTTDASAAILNAEREKGFAPACLSLAERAILAKLRSMSEEDFVPYDEGREGLHRRFAASAAESSSVAELLQRVKTKRYPLARLRRMLMRIYLELDHYDSNVPYLRVLACSEAGRALLKEMKTTSSLPVITKPAEGRNLDGAAREAFVAECRCTDLYALACPAVMPAGSDWIKKPIIL